MKSDWQPLETTTHQHHLIAHVIGARVIAYWIQDDSLHVLLDMEFIWTIYVDGQMSLLPYPIAVAELDVDDETRLEIKHEIQKFLDGTSGWEGRLLNSAPVECLIEEVLIYASGSQRRFVIGGENGSLVVETDVESGEVVLSIPES